MNSLHANDVTAIIVVISIVAVIALWFYKISKSNKKLTKEYNIKHKTNFKTHSDLMNYIRRKIHEKEMQRIAKKSKEQEEKRQEKERQKEERITATEPSSSGLGARLKKLRQMYKDGILSKVEFEKAKNKLLKWKKLLGIVVLGLLLSSNAFAEKNKKNNLKIKEEEKEQQNEERITASESSSSDLGARLKKLRQMYKDGILSKVEFEKAKNKLLKWPNVFYDLGDGVVVNRNWLLD